MTKKGYLPSRGRRQGNEKGQMFQFITYGYISGSKLLYFSDFSDNLDSGPVEIILIELIDCDDYFSCYFQQSRINYITQKVKKLRGGGY